MDNINFVKYKKALFFIILFFAVGVRLIYLDKGINSDEGLLLSFAKTNLNNFIPTIREYSVYPPLSAFLLHFWLKISTSEIWTRLYFVFFGILLCLLVFLIDKTFKQEKWPLFAFFLTSLSPLLIWASQFIRSYIEAAFWGTASIYFLFKIIKESEKKFFYWVGYLITAALASYTFYCNLYLVLAQNILMFIYCFRTKKILKKWIVVQVLLFICLIPDFILAVNQLSNADAINSHMIDKSFRIFNFPIGLYGKAIMGVCGMDPSLALSDSIKMLPIFKKVILFVFLPLIIVVPFIIYFIKRVKTNLMDIKIKFFFDFLCILYVICYMLAVKFADFPVLTKYFVVPHILFIFILSSIFSDLRRKISKVLLVIFFIIIYAFRLPAALEPEFDTKKAFNYVKREIKTNECLLMVRNTNYYLDANRKNLVVLRDYFIRNKNSRDYIGIDTHGKNILQNMLNNSNIVWFYKTSTNDEIFGANNLVEEWLFDNDFYPESVKKFKRIEITKYKKE